MVYLVVAASLFLTIVPVASVHAVVNNKQNVPDHILKTLRDNSQTIDGPNSTKYGTGGAYCDQTGIKIYKQGQESWLSQVNNNNSQEIEVSEGTNKIDLWYNALAYSCDRILGSNGRVAQQALQETQINVVSSRASVSGLPSSPLTVSGLDNNTQPVNLNYNTAYFYNNRFVKRGLLPNNLPSEEPAVRAFSVNGLSGLSAREAPYTINVTARDFMVNRFNENGTRYRCVYNPPDYRDANGLGDRGCRQVDRNFRIYLKVTPKYTGSCSITSINGVSTSSGATIEIPAGKQFGAGFKVTNNGTEDWSMFFVKMGSWLQADNRRWGPNRVSIKEEAILGGTFPVVRSKKSSSWATEGNTFTAPNIDGEYQFSWRILQEGGTAQGFKDIPNLGDCRHTVKVVTPKNYPFVVIEGGDVYAGATITGTGNSQASNDSRNANITTNGFHGDNVGSGLSGTSNAQYAVFASGNIGQLAPGRNTFRGNYGYRRNINDGTPPVNLASLDFLQDGLFANYETGGDYGRFYGESTPALPGIDVSNLVASTLPATAPIDSFISSSASGAVGYDGPITITGGTVPLGAKKIIVVNGDVTISGDIKYPLLYNNDQIPSLQIIAHNIYINQEARRVDANLVAWPNGSKDGIIDTCGNNGGSGLWPSVMVISSCKDVPDSFVINGSVSARKILLKRTGGTLGFKDTAADVSCYLANYTDDSDSPKITPDPKTAVDRYAKCAAERINVSPEGWLSEFNINDSTLQSVPTSTKELPPIF